MRGMERAGRGFALLATLGLGAWLTVALLPVAAPPRPMHGPQRTRLDPLSPYEKARVPDGYEARQVEGLWRLERVESDDRTLVLRAASGGCWKFDFMSMDATTGDAIRLTAWNEQWHPTRVNYACTAELTVASYRVRLSERVAGRRIDGQCVEGDSSPAERQCAAVIAVMRSSGSDA